MSHPSLEREILEELKSLTPEQQRRVLDLARSLSARPRGVSGKELLRFAGIFSPEEGEAIERAIEEGCERIDPDDW